MFFFELNHSMTRPWVFQHLPTTLKSKTSLQFEGWCGCSKSHFMSLTFGIRVMIKCIRQAVIYNWKDFFQFCFKRLTYKNTPKQNLESEHEVIVGRVDGGHPGRQSNVSGRSWTFFFLTRSEPPPTRTLLCPNSTPVHILGNNVDLRVKLSVHIMPTTI